MKKKRETIFIYKTEKGWIARFEDPKIFKLFGILDLPTPFTETADSEAVVRHLEGRNPECIVKLLNIRNGP